MSAVVTPVAEAGDIDAGQVAHRMAAVVQVQRMLAQSEATPDELMDRIPEFALSVVRALGAVFELLDGDAVVLRAGTAAVVAREAVGVRLPLQGSLTGEAIRLNRTVRCDDTEGDPRVALAACRKYGLRSVLVAVIRDRAGPIGVLKLFDGTPNRFGDAEADSLELVSEALGAAIQRRRAEDEAGRLLRNQMGVIQLQQDIAASTGGLQAALDLITLRAQQLTGADGASIALVDNGALVHRAASGAAQQLLRRRFANTGSLASLSIASGVTLCSDDCEVDPRVARAACRELGVRSMISAPLRADAASLGAALNLFCHRANAFRSAELSTLQLLAEWVGVVLQRGAAAEQLRSSEAQYRLLFAAHPLPMWVYDTETLRFLAVNDSAVTQYGYSRDEFLALDLRDIRPPGSVALLDSFLAARGDSPTTTQPWEHRRKDGSLIDVESTDSTIRFEGRDARLVLARDVTERKRVEREIQKSEALLNIAGNVARVGGWSLDLEDSSFSWTDELCSIFDVPAGTPCTVGQALDFYVPDSRSAIVAAFNRTRRDGTPYDLELEVVTATGRRRWVRSIGQAVRDADGAVVGARGAVQDITEQREAEAKARALAASLKTTLESITDAFYTLDRGWRFTYANGETERLLQRSREDLLGRCIWDLFPEAESADFSHHLRDAVERGATVVFETYYEPWRQWFELHAYPSESGLTVYFRDITDRRNAQERLLLLETCVAWMKDIVVITEVDPARADDTRIVFVNEAFVRHTGYSRAEALGATPRMLQGPGTQRPELERIAAALERREPVRAEVVNYTKAGEAYWVDLEIVPVWSPAGEVTHFVAVMRDATERRTAQETLHTLNETLEIKVAERTVELERSNDALYSKELEIRSVVEHMADGVVTFDDHGIVGSANPKVEAIFGYAPSQLLGRHISLLIPALEALDACGAGEPRVDAAAVIAAVGSETHGRHRSGDPVALDAAISDFRLGGQRLWTAIVRDIGERLRNMADLEQARRGAEEASSAKSAFVAAMSHEIRTPMNGVIGMLDVLHQTLLEPDQSRMLSIARDSAHALMAIIEDILDFSKIEAGRLELEKLPMSLGSIVEKASALVQGMAAGKGIELGVEIDPHLPAAVWGDAGRLRQVVVNLLSNAIKFSVGRSGAKVSVRARVGERNVDAVTLQLEVEDNGIGMDGETVGRLFQPFSQADASTTRRFGGTGLGLAISHHLVDLMDGSFEVRSTPDVGSVFTVRIPFFVAPASAGARPAKSAAELEVVAGPPVGAGSPSRPAGRVLVAEDNEINQKVITEQLTRLGYRAVVVANGREALALWRGGGFDAVLTDLQMPEMDGYELTATIRAEEGARGRIPIVALTANALKEEAGRCKATGMDDYLSKPVPMQVLDAMLQRWLGLTGTDAAPVDPSVLPSLIGDDRAMVGDFMLEFVDSATAAAAEMAAAIAAAQDERTRGIAHRLKSSARAVGAIGLGEICEAIEHASVGGDLASRSARLDAYESELDRVRRWVRDQGWSRPRDVEVTS